MDPDKVDKVISWKVPTSKTLMAFFIGAVGYLAPGCKDIHIPMQVLSKIAAPTYIW